MAKRELYEVSGGVAVNRGDDSQDRYPFEGYLMADSAPGAVRMAKDLVFELLRTRGVATDPLDLNFQKVGAVPVNGETAAVVAERYPCAPPGAQQYLNLPWEAHCT